MSEVRLVALLTAALVVVPALFSIVPWDVTFGGGVALVALGMAIGVPAGALYHVQLWRALRPARLWWLHPTALHARLDGAARRRVLGWFKLGAAGFVLAILGCALVAIGAFRSG